MSGKYILLRPSVKESWCKCLLEKWFLLFVSLNICCIVTKKLHLFIVFFFVCFQVQHILERKTDFFKVYESNPSNERRLTNDFFVCECSEHLFFIIWNNKIQRYFSLLSNLTSDCSCIHYIKNEHVHVPWLHLQ